MKQISFLVSVLAVCAAALVTAATDSTLVEATSYWHILSYWTYGLKPSADGTATVPAQTKTVNVTTAECVNRIAFPGRGTDATTDSCSFAGAGSLTYTGTDAGLVFENTATFPKGRTLAQLTFAPTSCIPSGVTAAFGGGGSITLSDVAGSGTLKVTDRKLYVTQPRPSFTGTVELDGGDFMFTPSAAGSLALASIARTRSGNFYAQNATVTVGALGPRENRAVLELGTGDKRILGTDDKVIVTDAATVPVHDGLVDPVILGRTAKTSYGGWSDLRADFVTYDATDGFKIFTPTQTLAEATATDVALVTNAVSATTKTVKGLVVEYAKKWEQTYLTVPEGVTLTVGDGTNPAALLVNTGKDGDGGQQASIAGSGTVAFGGSEGIVAFAAGHPYASLSVGPNLTGSNGMTFMNAVHQPSTLYLDKAAGWTGPTHVWNERLKLEAANRLPAGGHVYVDGEKGEASASIWFNSDMTLDQHFHVRGFGGLVNQPYGVFWAGAKHVAVTFTGSVELTGDADFNLAYASESTSPIGWPSYLTFACPITGTGLLTLAGGHTTLSSGSSVSGIDGIYLRGEARLYADRADLSKAGYLKGDTGTRSVFRLMDDLRFADGVRSEGSVKFVVGTNTLVGTSKIATLALEGGSVVTVDGHLTADVDETAMMDGNAKIVAARGGTSVFEVNAAADRSLAIGLEDGEGKLDFVKSGAGTLKLGGTLAYTGKTVVREGTLTFAKSIMDDPGISWWFDATDAAKLTANDDGKVMAVQSKVGTQRLVNWNASYTGPKVVNTLNGLDVFTYTHDDHDGFRTENETCQRTVFLVDLPRTHYKIMGLYGDYGDRGVRAENETDRYHWSTGGYVGSLRNTGRANNWQIDYAVGQPQIVALVQHTADNYTAAQAKDLYYSHYQAYIGLYCPYDSRGFDGDIAEMIAFNRRLSDEECLQVEKYLANRWGLTLAREPAGTASPARPSAASALEIASGATIDLAGRDLTVASLSGAGAIVNTGSTPAKLTVTGASDFRGTVGAGVTLRASGSLNLAVAAGGALDLTAGTTALGKNYYTPMTNDLALWLDASRAETITTNASGAAAGRVTEWRSLAGRMPGVVSGLGRTASRMWGPVYGTDSDGKPACCFDGSNYLARAGMAARTVIVAAKVREAPSFCRAIWGLHNWDSVWRAGNGNYTLGRNGFANGVMTIEHANGTSSLKLGADDRILSVTRFEDGLLSAYAWQNGANVFEFNFIDGPNRVKCVGFGLGDNFNGSVLQDVNEVIVYERYLTDAELAPTLEYLRDKWFRSAGATVGRQPEPVLAAGATLGLSGGSADLRALGPVSVATLANNGGGGSLAGDVTVTDAFTFDAAGATTASPLVVNGSLTLAPGAAAAVLGQHNLPHHESIPALRVTGTWTGAFAAESFEAPVRKWTSYLSGTDWGIEYPYGTLLLFR